MCRFCGHTCVVPSATWAFGKRRLGRQGRTCGGGCPQGRERPSCQWSEPWSHASISSFLSPQDPKASGLGLLRLVPKCPCSKYCSPSEQVLCPGRGADVLSRMWSRRCNCCSEPHFRRGRGCKPDGGMKVDLGGRQCTRTLTSSICRARAGNFITQ